MLKFDYKNTTHTAFCPLPFTKLIINAWGDITMCCHIGSEHLGNIRNADLLEVWRSTKAQSIREATSEGFLAKPCKNAPNCPFHLRDKIPFEFDVNSQYPLSLEIDLPAKHCNIGGETPTYDTACFMCIRAHSMPWNQEDITELICDKVRPLIPHLNKFCVLGVAEPFWKDAVFNIFEKVGFAPYKDKILFETNHNVTCFGKKTQDRFLDEVHHSNLQFSLDAATPKTYKKIRRLDAYNLCIKNLRRWMKVKNENHKVTIWNNINMLNVKEMTKMVETAIDLGVEAIYMLPTHNQNKKVFIGKLILSEDNLELFKKESVKAMHIAKLHGLDLRYIVPFHIVPKKEHSLIKIAGL